MLDALRQNQGDVVLAFIDSPADQSSPLRNIQGLLSVYEVVLNGHLVQPHRHSVTPEYFARDLTDQQGYR